MFSYLLLLISLSSAQDRTPAATDLLLSIKSTRATISEAERKQREGLGVLYSINKRIRQVAQKKAELTNKMMEREAKVRLAAQEVQELEERSERHKEMLNKRLRQLYQGRIRDDFQWLFEARSPVELESNQFFLKKMIDSDHKQIKQYIVRLRELKAKRNQLKSLVIDLAKMQKEVQTQEAELAGQMQVKSRHVAELRKMKDMKLNELKDLRSHPIIEDASLGYAFFERKGTFKPPVEAKLAREFGAYVDSQFKFRLMHKGLFFAAKPGTPVNAIFEGVVEVAGDLPGFGKTVIIDHGDNYYSVYAFVSSININVKRGNKVREGDIIGSAGGVSPLFGPGLYFEIRHFTDAVDPKSWIKDPIKTAQVSVQPRSNSWDVVSGTAGQ